MMKVSAIVLAAAAVATAVSSVGAADSSRRLRVKNAQHEQKEQDKDMLGWVSKVISAESVAGEGGRHLQDIAEDGQMSMSMSMSMSMPFVCDLCAGAGVITNPDGVIEFPVGGPEPLSCGFILTAAEMGNIPEGQECTALQFFIADQGTCECSAGDGGATGSPAPVCDICGGAGVVVNPDALVDIEGPTPPLQCSFLAEQAAIGNVPDCDATVEAAAETCCGFPPTDPPTDAPTVTPPFFCDVCDGNGGIINPNDFVNILGSNIRCSVIGSAASGGRISEADCDAVAQLVEPVCCGETDAPTDAPTTAPVAPTEAPVVPETESPTEVFVCDICDRDDFLFPDAVVDFGGLAPARTCSDLLEAAELGRIPEGSDCDNAQNFIAPVCCGEITDAPVVAPTVPTDAPTAAPVFTCDICGGEGTVINPDTVIDFGGLAPPLTCSFVQNAASVGNIAEGDECDNTQIFAAPVCCGEVCENTIGKF